MNSNYTHGTGKQISPFSGSCCSTNIFSTEGVEYKVGEYTNNFVSPSDYMYWFYMKNVNKHDS